MSQEEISKIYNAEEWEDKLYAIWQKSGFFNPDECIKAGVTRADAEPFSIVLPPPNVTGTLHTGSACMLAIEDLVVRFKRMQGYRTLWIPGTDHAAIATQSKVEKIIYKEEGKTRHDLGRAELLRRIEAFAKESHDTIIHQTKKLGSSLDWSREAYTLDEKRNLAVRTAFKQMYDDGIIYRGDRIVNWDPNMQTTVSDDEIEWKTETAPFYYLQYGPFVISTARPETKFGDKYVVMHPDDERYQEYVHGQKIDLEWINGPVTATVIKDAAIDQEFGTGVMTITPWHDNTDFEIAERHHLDKEQIISEQGKLLPIAAEFAGLAIGEAREKIVDKLKAKGLIVKIEDDYSHNIATNSRGSGQIEPQIKKQWFIAVNKEFERAGKKITLKSLMLDAVESGKTHILPERFEKTYFHWVNNLRDWCISRQIWYGHRIPVWYCLNCETPVVDAKIKSHWFFVRHGETDSNKQRITQGQKDVPLNDTGRQQVKAAAERLKNQDIGLIVSSDLGRCQETAHIIADIIGDDDVPIEYDSALQERSYGDAEGLPYDETRKRFGRLYENYETSPGNIESPKNLEERVAAAFAKHKEMHGHKNVVIVSHGGALRMLMKSIRNLSFEETRERARVRNAEILSLDILDTPCATCGNDMFEQDCDTLDTWFSSGLWTFSTLGWPAITEDFKTYHPTALLETGYDILPFWVSRMILMSTYLLGTVPFKTVYLHGLVRDAEGRKMSKSLDNILDPLDVIRQYGADALRLSLVIGSTPGNDLKLGDEKIKSFRNFTNKLWNVGRYVSMTNNQNSITKGSEKAKSPADQWILKRLKETVEEVTELIEHYQLSLAGEKLRDFTWNEFADWYVEIHKVERNDALLHFVFETLLKLWHPFMPYVTEALWEVSGNNKKNLLMIEKWPEMKDVTIQSDDAQRFQFVIGLIQGIRALRSIYKIDPAKQLSLSVKEGAHEWTLIRDNGEIFKRLARIAEIHILKSGDTVPEKSVLVQSGLLQAYIELEGVIDFAAEKKRLEKEKAEKEKYMSSLETKLGNKNFIAHAKPAIVAAEQAKLRDTESQLADLAQHLASLS